MSCCFLTPKEAWKTVSYTRERGRGRKRKCSKNVKTRVGDKGLLERETKRPPLRLLVSMGIARTVSARFYIDLYRNKRQERVGSSSPVASSKQGCVTL
jgi:hypothetical protein